MRKEKVTVRAWKTEDFNWVEHEAKAYIRKGWHRLIPMFIYELFATPDFEWAGTTKRIDWVSGEHLIATEFAGDTEFLQYVREKYNVDLEFEFWDVTDEPYMIGFSEYFEDWTHEGCTVELKCIHPAG